MRIGSVHGLIARSIGTIHPIPGLGGRKSAIGSNMATADLLATIRQELGSEFEIVDEQVVMAEDPDLDKYLAYPKGFRR